MDVTAWQERLESTFTRGGVVGGSLLPVMRAEKAYESFVVETFHGHSVLTDSFLGFFVETLTLAGELLREPARAGKRAWYWPLLVEQTANFRTFRAAENLLLRGYPLAGFSLLRDVKDQAIMCAAIAAGITTYPDAHGFKGESAASLGKEAYMTRIRKRRMKEERRVRCQMVGRDSGLGDSDIKELERWAGMFHSEVHGARLTLVLASHQWYSEMGTLPLAPEPNVDSVGMYLCRSDEIGWLLLRTFPFLQLTPRAFGNEWAEKWTVLDDSFREAIRALQDLRKNIAATIARLVDAKFAFSPDSTHYRES